MSTTRRFICESCGALEYEITVEPMYDEAYLREMLPDRLLWLDAATACPHCGEEVDPQ